MFALVAHATLVRPSSPWHRRFRTSHPGVQILDVLPDHDEVDAPTAVRRLHARHLADGTDVRVRLEELPERHVRRLLAEADGRFQRTLQGDPRPRDRVHRLLGDPRRDPLGEHGRPGLGRLPVDRCPGGLDDPPRRLDAFGTDPVTGDQRDGHARCVCGHVVPPRSGVGLDRTELGREDSNLD